ncbi:YicC/YloC family endoribonuclease [Candidatus Albibeggiatoa sp. nov. NOAA]|uniref:YicC/YloC family endoribonuclease n=1 Tax=Candidatus Albibeggiatoa sp. nov. NOAA TaxID=3162724 RepID=UPI0033051FAD|nr:YicC family protein [Thiotrichaceae bacterium]
MVRSMTAFARKEQQEQWGQVCWELRSVNHRYLDINIRLPEEFRNVEVTIREKLQAKLKRGKIDCTLYFKENYANDTDFTLNLSVVKKLLEAVNSINSLTGVSQKPSALDILHWQGVMETNKLDNEALQAVILQHFDTALTDLITQREREGQQLAELLKQRCETIVEQVAKVKTVLPDILQAQRDRLYTRLAELKELNHERIEQEIAIIAQKMDVAEELDRMGVHIDDIQHILNQAQNGAIGRRLDFMVQELHREANTLGAKSNHIDTTRSAVDLKVLIDQMREQIQNIE